MARRPSDRPWFRSDRNAWFITINGKQHNLGPDENQAEIKLLQLKLEAKQAPPPTPAPVADVTLVLDVIDEFLEWCSKHREPRTHQFYQEKTQSFIDYLKAHDTPYLAAADLRPFHLQKWADSHEDWANGQKRQAIMSVQRAFNWAVKNGRIDRSPVQQVEKPPAGKRELVITSADHQAMLDGTRCDEIRDLLNTCWEVGCRPQEVMRVEARHADLDRRRWVFAKKESKGKKRIRIVYLSDVAFEITQRLAEKYPEGTLFRNSDGVPWTRHAINCVMLRLARKTGKKFA